MGTTPAAPQVKAINCPNCGAGVELRGMGQSVSAVCVQCLSIIDTKDPNLAILQTFESRQRIRPLIPLGTRGKLRGDAYEAIGFQARVCEVEGVEYEWREYVLFNPYKGFRYLSEYNGHWNDIVALDALPRETTAGKFPAAIYLGKTYRHFQSVSAQTIFVMGEFPWRAKVREVAMVSDFVAPPQMLSSERVENEVTWSLGEYTTGARIWQAFQLQGSPPPATGVYSNQPSPYQGRTGRIWSWYVAALLGLALMMFASSALMRQEQVFRSSYAYSSRNKSDTAFVTEVFELKGRTSNVEVNVETDLDNRWTFFNMALINEETGQALDFGREIGYYHGTDSDGAWSEGKRNDRAVIPAVPSGRYYLRVEPEMEPGAPAVNYTLTLRRDVPSNQFLWIAALLLMVPPVFVSLRSASFEGSRWSESGHASSGSSEE